MKKKTSLILFLLSILSYIPWYMYKRDYFVLINENGANISYFLQYIFYWFVCLFVLSLFAWKLEESKYKNWLKTSMIVVLISVYWGYKNDLTGNSVVDINGELTTIWLLSAYSLFSIIYFIKNFIKSRKVNIK